MYQPERQYRAHCTGSDDGQCILTREERHRLGKILGNELVLRGRIVDEVASATPSFGTHQRRHNSRSISDTGPAGLQDRVRDAQENMAAFLGIPLGVACEEYPPIALALCLMTPRWEI